MVLAKERTIRTTALRRIAYFDRKSVDQESRTVALAFSSEQPVSRWFGDEILDHGKKSVRLDRLKSTGPLLLNHDSREHIGTIESARIDKDRVGRAVVRLGQGPERDAILQDIEDGIRKCVSVGYRIHRMKLEEQSDDEPDIYRATDWEPFEVSLVSMPADTNVGVGREAREWHSGEGDHHDTIIVEVPAQEQRTMPSENTKLSLNKGGKAKEATEAERTRIRLITKVGKQYHQEALAERCVDESKSIAEFNELLLEAMPGATGRDARTASPEAFELGMPANRGEARPASGWQTLEGKPVPVLRSEDSLTNRLIKTGTVPQDQQGLDVGEAIRSLITGRWPEDGRLRAALATGTDGSGGFWLTPTLSSQVIDLARSKSVLLDAGAQTIVMPSSELAVVRVTGDPAIGWVAENALIPEADPTFGRLTFRARKLAARVKISRELAADAPNAADQIRAQLGTVLGLSLDQAALIGDADGEEVVGLFNHDDVQELAAVGSPTYDDLIDAVQLVEDANGASSAFIIPPSVKNTLAKLKDSNGAYLAPPSDLTELRRFVTKQLANAQACIGDFSQVLFGVREEVQVELSTEGGDTWERDQVEIKIRWRGDVQFAQPTHLVRLIGIT